MKGILESEFDYFAIFHDALNALIAYPGEGIDNAASNVKRAFAYADEALRQWNARADEERTRISQHYDKFASK